MWLEGIHDVFTARLKTDILPPESDERLKEVLLVDGIIPERTVALGVIRTVITLRLQLLASI